MKRLWIFLVVLSLVFVVFNCQKKVPKPAVEQKVEQPAIVDTTVVPVDTTQVPQ